MSNMANLLKYFLEGITKGRYGELFQQDVLTLLCYRKVVSSSSSLHMMLFQNSGLLHRKIRMKSMFKIKIIHKSLSMKWTNSC